MGELRSEPKTGELRHLTDTANKFMVGMQGDKIVIMLAYKLTAGISHEEALNLAAYLVALICDKKRFEEVLKAIENT